MLTGQARGDFLGQKHHRHTVLTRGGQVDTLLGHFSPIKNIRNLDEDASAVTHQLVCANGTAMVQVFKDFEALLNDGVIFFTLDVGNEAHATGIVLVCWRIKTLGLRHVCWRASWRQAAARGMKNNWMCGHGELQMRNGNVAVRERNNTPCLLPVQ